MFIESLPDQCPMAQNRVSRLLGDNPELEPLRQRLARVTGLQRAYLSFAPERLAKSSRVCAIEGSVIVIVAANGPVATVLKQLAPRLLEKLKSSTKSMLDQELTGIRVEVQADRPAPTRPAKPRSAMPRERFAEWAAGMQASVLKETLERLAQVDQKTRTRSKT
jgi:hypothetical protein